MPNARDARNGLEFSNLVELILYRAERQAADVAYIFHDYSPRAAPGARDVMSFGELATDAMAVAGMLQARGLQGQRVLVLFGSGLDFIRAYFGCVLAGAHPVPLRPPLTPEYRRQLAMIGKDAAAKGLMCPASMATRVRAMLEEEEALRDLWVVSPEDRHENALRWAPPSVQPEDVGLIQYTSGSTGTPKGVVVSHGNLLANEAAIREAFGHDEHSAVVGWLPMFHDMGLIGNVIQSLYLGAPNILMDPMAFLQKPTRLLQLITRYRGTTCGGPNFGYEHCVNRVQQEELGELDLSSWTLAYSGAEPIRMATMQRFSAKFARAGFRPESFYPCYGMAEATLFVTGIHKRALPTSVAVDTDALSEDRVCEVTAESSTRMMEVVSCGYPRAGHAVRIVEPDTQDVCGDGQVGEIWFAGGSVAQGYVRRDDLTQAVFHAALHDDARRYLRTGDLGFTLRGELYVMGRMQDLIVIGGRKYYPQEIEATALAVHANLRPTCGAAFSSFAHGEERLVLVHEVRSDALSAREVQQLVAAARAAVAREHGLDLYDLVLVRARGVPKTSSGKLQRRRCRRLYESDALRRVTGVPEHESSLSAAEETQMA